MLDPRPPLLIAAALVAPAADASEERQRVPAPTRRVTEVTIQSRMVIRIPRLPIGRMPVPAAAPAAPVVPIRWVERKAERCIPVQSLAAASVAVADSVDLLLAGGKRLRARFGDDCPSLDFYSGLYVKLNGDGKLCSARDSIRSRSGGECRIRSFSALVPAR